MSDRPDVHAMIRELCHPSTHTERIQQPHTNTDGSITWHTTTHQTTSPPLLDQLLATHTANGQQGGSATGFASQPPANVGAIDAAIRIDIAAARWVRDLGEDDPGNTKQVVLKLSGLLPSVVRCGKKPEPECCTWHLIETDIRHWWTTARCVTGWDEAPWKPDNTCPLCTERRSLRIRLTDHLATCTECHASWGPDEIGLLAEHIRAENGEHDEGDAA
jgi:hypothetical protein